MSIDRLQRILGQTTILGEDVLNKIPVIECNEPLVDLTIIPNIKIQMSKARREYAGSDLLFARKTIFDMLAKTVDSISNQYRFVVFDAYRPIDYQRMRYQLVFQNIQSQHPDYDSDHIRRLAFEVVFPPDEDPQQPPPHATGAAIDVGLENLDGSFVDFGSTYGIYNDIENKKHITNSLLVTPDQRKNREILISAMVNAGFCNYPGEWWHFMYGDREYAAYEGMSQAIYGRADLLVR